MVKIRKTAGAAKAGLKPALALGYNPFPIHMKNINFFLCRTSHFTYFCGLRPSRSAGVAGVKKGKNL
ncbi:hypothetical protein DCC81_24035 [Chitinophaga parva]|uniref:Uncharacterized protein n=1 Tax=Chitinophaga parva TaxID=2169414 RepID=A0A2T7BBA9_9BACT|nr:hypothetical protein DCC81_24035 [Chitinophaga parva]